MTGEVGTAGPVPTRGLRIEAHGLTQRAGARTTLLDVSLTVRPGQLVAVIGASGAGKTTLLDALAGLRPAAGGTLRYDGADPYADPAAYRSVLGYVPQDDIIHRELPLARTLRYAARLRLPAGTAPATVDDAVAGVLRTLGLTARAGAPVGQLSGGERKRASIAVELLTRPRAFFLDEPTSGLDPATAAEVVGTLRQLADAGSTVVFTTHNPADVESCDQVGCLAGAGRLAFAGAPADARRHFRAASTEQIYQRLAERPAADWAADWTAAVQADPADQTSPAVQADPADQTSPAVQADPADQTSPAVQADQAGQTSPAGQTNPVVQTSPVGQANRASRAIAAGKADQAGRADPAGARPVGAVRQWALLTRRNLDILTSSRLTLAILIGSPVAVLLMIVALFRPHAFAPATLSPSATAMILFWIAFGGFFFGLTYGLLQICTEVAILRRERFVVLRLGPYLLAKLALLLPLLAVVDAAMLAVLRATDRLPAAGLAAYGSMFGTLLLSSAAALALGLLASAAVAEPGQATLALPMLCFPQVLFSGAILPVPIMAVVGKALSYPMSNRWTFEGLGHAVDLNGRWASGASPLGPPLLASYGDTFSRAVPVDWTILAGFTIAFLGWAWLLLARRTGPPAPSRGRGLSSATAG